ncbi:MAG: polyprenyl synthetase family protein, partial [Flavobacteriaceae bacterium]|nr:polyprenyl synthetase family protein [Flavobacteriaceae bacterium]
NYKKAFPAALAVEVFHNFSLIHDDIMDSAPLRRGNPTVHHRWNENIGILSGDAMLIQAYSFIDEYPNDIYREIMKLFNKTAIEVCEGQQYDMDFEQVQDVTLEQYVEMIQLKTAVLLASAFEIGAIIGKASVEDRKSIYQFGLNLGLAFQIQDDYLDTFGNAQTFGKQIGGDILENKKTYLYLVALKNSNQHEQNILKNHYQNNNPTDKIKNVTQFFIDKNIPELAQQTIESYTKLCLTFVDKLSISTSNKQQLKELGINLMNRSV